LWSIRKSTKKLQKSTTGCCYLSQTKAQVMMMMTQYTNCVVKAHKVQTVKLTLYKYKSWSQCPMRSKIRLQTVIISHFRLL